MKVVVAGSSGFLGSHLVTHLETAGHDVTRLVRRSPRSPGESQWDPYAGRVDRAVIAAADAVVNLAGSPTAGNPHSRSWARNLRGSRVTTTRLLAQTIAAVERPPVYLAQNGISWYGDRGGEPLTERSDSRGDAFLTEVTREWEEAAAPAGRAGARVCVLRTSPVLDKRSAPLRQLVPLFRLGLGTRLGDGQQYFPVISLRDWVGATAFLLDHRVAGPVNLCCPQTPTNAEFTETLADLLGRSARLSAPAAVLRPAAARMAPELLSSRNTAPTALTGAGFVFADTDVRDVLATALS